MSIGNLKDSGNQGNNMPWQWKMLQGIQAIATATSAPLTCVDDSVTICNANIDAFTFTNILGNDALNVNIAGGVTLEVNLDPDNDSVGIYGYTNPANPATFTGIKVDANGELQVDVLTMPATFAEDSAHVSGNTGAFVMGVRNDSNTAMTSANGDYSPIAVNNNGAVAINDGGNTITVDALGLDIRVLDCATDSVSICAGGTPITSTTIVGATGLDVNIIQTNVPNVLNSLEQTGVLGDLSSFGPNITSISFASVGTAAALVSVDGGATYFPVASGTTINLSADGPTGFYSGTSFFWDTLTNVGSSLIIIYNYI